MAQITLNDDEARMLDEILTNYLSDLRMEVAGTENMNFREKLKQKEVFLKRLLENLEKAMA